MHRVWLIAVYVLCGLPACALAAGAVVQVKVPAVSDGEHQVDDYIHGLLKAALTRSLGPDESLDLVVSDVINTQNRTITELMKGRQLDLMWTMTTQDRELKMRPVRVPIFRGMLGYRVLLIKQGKQSTFDAVNTLAQLAPLKAGQDPQWPDTTILASAGLRVVSGPYTQLFTMLRNDRIDYFPRGMNEVLPELAAEQGLALENHLLLAYPAPMYFFVRKANEDLARRLEVGLASMVQDGSYEDYFNNHPLIVNTLNALNVAKRRIIALPNPLLPAETPLSDPRLWLFPPAN